VLNVDFVRQYCHSKNYAPSCNLRINISTPVREIWGILCILWRKIYVGKRPREYAGSPNRHGRRTILGEGEGDSTKASAVSEGGVQTSALPVLIGSRQLSPSRSIAKVLYIQYH
jgi:hypothetical protein